MRSLSLISLMVVLAICYLLYFRSAGSGPDAESAQTGNADVYKADMDQARAAARLMAKGHEESKAH